MMYTDIDNRLYFSYPQMRRKKGKEGEVCRVESADSHVIHVTIDHANQPRGARSCGDRWSSH